MNKEYICEGSYAVVTDEFGDKKQMEYSENIEEILVQENLIEQMEIELRTIIYARRHNNNISFKLLTKSLIVLLAIPLILVIFPLILGFINLNMISLIELLSGILIPGYLGFFLIYEYNNTNKTNKGYENQIEFLKKQISLEQEKLNELKQNKAKKQKVAVSKRVNDIEELKKLKELLLVYYNCGYYSDRYSKYLERGKLRTKLSKTFSEEQIDLTIKHLEGKGKVLKN